MFYNAMTNVFLLNRISFLVIAALTECTSLHHCCSDPCFFRTRISLITACHIISLGIICHIISLGIICHIISLGIICHIIFLGIICHIISLGIICHIISLGIICLIMSLGIICHIIDISFLITTFAIILDKCKLDYINIMSTSFINIGDSFCISTRLLNLPPFLPPNKSHMTLPI